MNYLVDACVISEIIKPLPDENVLKWLSKIPDGNIYLSVITIGELQKGVARLGSTRRAQELQLWLDNEVSRRFQLQLLAIDSHVAVVWGKICAEKESHSKPKPAIDALIAATAIAKNMTLVSRNTSNMDFPGLTIVDPWVK
jgi:predicted nucleic acid-binding protein